VIGDLLKYICAKNCLSRRNFDKN